MRLSPSSSFLFLVELCAEEETRMREPLFWEEGLGERRNLGGRKRGRGLRQRLLPRDAPALRAAVPTLGARGSTQAKLTFLPKPS